MNCIVLKDMIKIWSSNMFCLIRYADNVEEGDEVLTTINDKLIPAEVIKITRVMLEGR